MPCTVLWEWFRPVWGNSRMEFEESKNECELHFLLHTLNYDAHFISKKKNDWQYMYGINGMAQNSLNQGEEVLIPEYRMIDAGMFAMASKSMERWSFNGGFRYDVRHITSDELQEEGVLRFAEFTRFFNSVSGSVGTVYTCGENCSLRMNVARGFRAPNISELASKPSLWLMVALKPIERLGCSTLPPLTDDDV